jgi:hypothetical protein
MTETAQNMGDGSIWRISIGKWPDPNARFLGVQDNILYGAFFSMSMAGF